LTKIAAGLKVCRTKGCRRECSIALYFTSAANIPAKMMQIVLIILLGGVILDILKVPK
jgi:hypothetical protein